MQFCPHADSGFSMQGQDIATVEITSKWRPNKALEAKKCYGTTSIEHPAVSMITTERGRYYMGALASMSSPSPPAVNRTLWSQSHTAGW